jgi:hypothetical protein
MHKFHYRAGRNALTALFMAALALLCGWRLLDGGGWLAAGGVLLFGAAALRSAMNGMSDEPALSFDAQRLTVRTTTGSKQVTWPEVQGISIEVFTYRYWGIIPLARHENLVIKCNGGALGARRLRIALASIELPPGGSAALVHALHQQHVAALGEAGVAMAGAGETGWGARPGAARRIVLEDESESSSGFDPDAALARYLAAREQQSALAAVPAAAPAPVAQPMLAPSPPVRAGFGRKGL